MGILSEQILPLSVRGLQPMLLDGDFVERAETLLAFALPGRGKTNFLAAFGREFILRHRYPGLFTPTFKPVQKLLAAKQELRFSSAWTAIRSCTSTIWATCSKSVRRGKYCSRFWRNDTSGAACA